MFRQIDPELVARLTARAPGSWPALCAWMDAAPDERGAPVALGQAETALAGWPSGDRKAEPRIWAGISAGGGAPPWWPLVRSLVVDDSATLEPAEALRAMVVLRFGRRTAGLDLRPLAAMPDLRDLDLGGLDREALADAPPLANLERLAVAAETLPADLAARFPALRSLSLANSAELSELQPLPPGLTCLNLAGCANLRSLDAVGACRQLQGVELQGCDGLGDISALATLPALERVRLDARRSRSLQPLAGAPALRELWVGGGQARVDLSPLGGHVGLRVLGIEACAAVDGLSGLELPALEALHILRCGIDGLPDLGASPALRILDLEGLGRVDAIPALSPGGELDLLRLVGLSALAPDAARPRARRIVEAAQ